MTGFSPTDYRLASRPLAACLRAGAVRSSGAGVACCILAPGWGDGGDGVSSSGCLEAETGRGSGTSGWRILAHAVPEVEQSPDRPCFLFRESGFVILLLGTWLWLVGGRPDFGTWLDESRPLILLTGYLIAIFPLRQLISLATQS